MRNILLLGAVLFVAGCGITHAQNPSLTPSTLIIPSSISHTTTCPAPVAGSTIYCWAGDGEWESDSGAAYFKHGAATAPVTGVTSWNGLTGAVTYAPPVTSVQGKTGAVTLAVQEVEYSELEVKMFNAIMRLLDRLPAYLQAKRKKKKPRKP